MIVIVFREDAVTEPEVSEYETVAFPSFGIAETEEISKDSAEPDAL